MNEQPKPKTRVGLIVLFSCIALFIGLLLGLGAGAIGGLFVYKTSSVGKAEEKVNEIGETIKEGAEKIKETAEKQIKNVTIKAEDQYVVSTYNDELIVYMINNGKLYYKYSKDRIAGLNVCPSTEKYCTENSTYTNKMELVTGVSDVVKVKATVKVNALDDSFEYFAIDSKGDVYELNKTSATKFLEDKKVVDLVSVKFTDKNYYYEFSTSTGKNVLKRWVWLEGESNFAKGEWRVEEKDK